MSEYHGHKTMKDGTRVPISKDEAEQIWESIQKRKAETEALMPTEQSALDMMARAFHRLKDFGWNDACYCPKDGSMFDAIEVCSTGIHKCTYQGEWPKGGWWIHGGDTWPSRPVLYRKEALPNPPSEDK